MLPLDRPWPEYEFVAFDTETSGAYPIGYDIVEFGAVKWKSGKIIDTYQTLLKPREPMSDFVIGIHGITNEMVADAPMMKDKIGEIKRFFEGSILMAHHAPFDMGFVAFEFEKHKVPFPSEPALCTSLLSRQMITESPNHKLQTLITVLGLDRGAAHRAQDDARNCLSVGLESMKRLGEQTLLESVLKKQGKILTWDKYNILNSSHPLMSRIVEAIYERLPLDIVYDGGSTAGETRRIGPIGVVRNPDGDYIMAKCFRDAVQKRFYIAKIKDAAVAY